MEATKEFRPAKVTYSGFSTEFLDRFDYLQKNVMKEQPQINAAIQKLSTVLKKEFFDLLYPFQREGIARAYLADFKFLIGDEMGLGKTFQALACIQWCVVDEEKSKKVLIVCPSSLRIQWARELFLKVTDFFDSSDDILTVLKGADLKKGLQQYKVIVISYDLAVKFLTELQNQQFHMAVLDESHMIKNHSAKRTRVMLQLLTQIPHRLLLSGTPALARPRELHPQINAINPKMFPEFDSFAWRYCSPRQMKIFVKGEERKIWTYDGSTNLSELYMILNNNIMVRRLKKNVLSQLPNKIREYVPLQVKIPKSMMPIMTKAEQMLDKSTKPTQTN